MDPPATRPALTPGIDAAPRKPEQPDPLDCCGSGCVRCIFDVHDEAMQRYLDEHAAWAARQVGGPVDSDQA